MRQKWLEALSETLEEHTSVCDAAHCQAFGAGGHLVGCLRDEASLFTSPAKHNDWQDRSLAAVMIGRSG